MSQDKKYEYEVNWGVVDELSFSEVCDWLDIDIVKNKIQCPSSKHEDNNPSCSIKDDKFCYCFSCHYSASPLKLIQTTLNLSKFKALQFIDQHIPVLSKKKQTPTSDVFISKWELHCLGLQKNPLYPTTVAFENPLDKTRMKFHESLPAEVALEIINDKFIENCATEKMFANRFIPYAKNIFYNALLDRCDFGPSPSNQLEKYDSKESFDKAQAEYEKRKQNYVAKHTGLNFQVLQEWFFSSKQDLIDKAILEVSKKHYKELGKKIDNIIFLLEAKEELLNDRQSAPTMV